MVGETGDGCKVYLALNQTRKVREMIELQILLVKRFGGPVEGAILIQYLYILTCLFTTVYME